MPKAAGVKAKIAGGCAECRVRTALPFGQVRHSLGANEGSIAAPFAVLLVRIKEIASQELANQPHFFPALTLEFELERLSKSRQR